MRRSVAGTISHPRKRSSRGWRFRSVSSVLPVFTDDVVVGSEGVVAEQVSEAPRLVDDLLGAVRHPVGCGSLASD